MVRKTAWDMGGTPDLARNPPGSIPEAAGGEKWRFFSFRTVVARRHDYAA
jgi:hypothetical protein